MESFFAPCPRGLESVLERELSAIGATGTQVEPGGVAFVGDLVLAMRANLESRVASRILWTVRTGSVRNGPSAWMSPPSDRRSEASNS